MLHFPPQSFDGKQYYSNSGPHGALRGARDQIYYLGVVVFVIYICRIGISVSLIGLAVMDNANRMLV